MLFRATVTLATAAEKWDLDFLLVGHILSSTLPILSGKPNRREESKTRNLRFSIGYTNQLCSNQYVSPTKCKEHASAWFFKVKGTMALKEFRDNRCKELPLTEKHAKPGQPKQLS